MNAIVRTGLEGENIGREFSGMRSNVQIPNRVSKSMAGGTMTRSEYDKHPRHVVTYVGDTFTDARCIAGIWYARAKYVTLIRLALQSDVRDIGLFADHQYVEDGVGSGRSGASNWLVKRKLALNSLLR